MNKLKAILKMFLFLFIIITLNISCLASNTPIFHADFENGTAQNVYNGGATGKVEQQNGFDASNSLHVTNPVNYAYMEIYSLRNKLILGKTYIFSAWVDLQPFTGTNGIQTDIKTSFLLNIYYNGQNHTDIDDVTLNSKLGYQHVEMVYKMPNDASATHQFLFTVTPCSDVNGSGILTSGSYCIDNIEIYETNEPKIINECLEKNGDNELYSAIKINFNVDMYEYSVTDTANYKLNGKSGNIDSVVKRTDGSYLIKPKEPFEEGTEYTLYITGLKSALSIAMSDYTYSFTPEMITKKILSQNFEKGSHEGVNASNANLSMASNDVYGGNYALKVEKLGTFGQIQIPLTGLKAGGKYIVSSQIKLLPCDGMSCDYQSRVVFSLYYGEQQHLAYSNAYKPSDGYKTISYTYTAETGCEDAMLVIFPESHVINSATHYGMFLADDINVDLVPEYNVGLVSYYNVPSTSKIANLETGNINVALSSVKNNYGNGNMVFINALYKDNTLIGINTANLMVSPGETLRNISASINVPILKNGDYRLSTYLWNNLNELRLIGNSKSIAHENYDTQEVKYLVDENFLFVYKEGNIATNKLRPSGWDIRDAGGSFAQSYHQGNFKIIDNSSELPVEMNRKFESVTFGDLVLEYRIKFVTYADGISWSMSKGYSDGMKIVTDNGGLYLQQPDGGAVFLSECETDKDYGIKAIIHMESKTVSVYINGKLAAEGKAMLSPVESIDNFDLNTGDLAKCEMYFPQVKIYRGYKVNERFISSTAAIPDDWEVISNGGSALVYQTGSRSQPDIYSLKLDGTNGETAIQKIIDPQNRSMVFECKFLIPEKSDGVNILLQNSNGGLLSVNTSNGSLCYNVSGADVPFYDYLKNLWYHLRIELDLPSSTANLYLNGKLKQEDIALSAFSEINTITLKAYGASALFDDILLYPKADEPDDYVPAPQKAQSTDYAVGMQTCPLWKEGNHLGWDWINSDPKRKPYLGFYDENSPELADWEIKYMVEHGINYMMQCWYQPVAPKDEPIKDSYGGWSINDAYFYAKYSNMLDFMILWENSAAGSSNASYDFENNIIPYWIEYYLKDSRYFRLNNRPVIGIYNYNVFVTAFGGEEGAKAGLALLRQKCIEANVGNPILITTSSSGGNIGFDYLFAYNFGTGDIAQEKIAMLNWKSTVDANPNINIIPCLSMGYDASAWYESAGSYAKPEDYRTLAKWVKEEYAPTLKNSGLDKQMVLCNSWNEYGEGHFIMPSDLYGFGYLDALRDIFIGGNSDHTGIDVTPTEHQKDRFNNLYPWFRAVKTIVRSEEPEIPTDIKKGWYFETDSEGWSPYGCIGGFTAAGGAICGNITGSDPIIISSDNLGIDISDVTYIRIKMKNATPNLNAEMYFTTTADTAFNEYKSVKFNVIQNDSGYTEYYLDTWNCLSWKGTLKRLRIDPVVAIKAEGSFYIDSIELLYNANGG